ncbi:Response regulator receiver and ANTAR domain protein [uncultured Stenotrophomonas sp.]|uniref:Response regulator receiver and ANTAR domain protein n=1 Tax=uncultured Stenotrophomonas sp. TaxID=165438 RepID=A0A1Y5Q4U1_9GAMM|nr:Response regulator receiver and ANTAR domain protein [uncultured Stenotrophomonas sp.]
MLRILLIDDTGKDSGDLRAALSAAGYEVLPEAVGSDALFKAVQARQPDVLVVDVESPSCGVLEQLALVERHAPRPVVMFSANDEEPLIQAAVEAGVTAYIVDGRAPARLRSIIQVAQARFARQSQLHQRLQDVQQKLQDRKLVEQAKGMLMDRRGMSEADAYAALRRQAMKQNLKLVDVARRVLAVAELLG